jgi:2-dehydro-3-deoxyphosphooctonate aldolase (KDO 8-P synthase)
LFVIAGPDVLESRELAVTTARALSEAATRLGIALVFKSSYPKANRSSHDAYVSPGLERGLQILAE